MKWEDEGILLASRPHGERNKIIDVFTPSQGRHLGMVKNVTTTKQSNLFEPGTQLKLVWKARLEEHLGVFSTEIIKSRTLILIKNKKALLGFNAIASLLLIFLPEREPFESIYYRTINLIDSIESKANWIADYIAWELLILSELGYGLDLSVCAVTGGNSNLTYVSPKTGRAVSKEAGKDWKHKLLPLPNFLLQNEKELTTEALKEGLTLTGYFLEKWVLSTLNRQALPDARHRFLNAIFS